MKTFEMIAILGAIGIGGYALLNFKGGLTGGADDAYTYNTETNGTPAGLDNAPNSEQVAVAGVSSEAGLPAEQPTIFSFLSGRGASESGLTTRDVTVPYPSELNPFTREHSATWYKNLGFGEQALAMNLVTGQAVWDWRESEGQEKVERHTELLGARIRETELELAESKAGDTTRSSWALAAYEQNKTDYIAHLTERQGLAAQGIMTPKSKQQRQLFARDPDAYREKYG